jgi:hypothetical protein
LTCSHAYPPDKDDDTTCAGPRLHSLTGRAVTQAEQQLELGAKAVETSLAEPSRDVDPHGPVDGVLTLVLGGGT